MPIDQDTDLVKGLLTSVIKHAKAGVTWNPLDLVGLGTANIFTYRREIAMAMNNARLDVSTQLALFELTMAQNNKARIVKGAKTQPELFPDGPKKNALNFIINNCVQKTAEHKLNKVCSLKIPSSFPEICAVLFVIHNKTKPEAVIVKELIEQLWFASIAMSEAMQEKNKAASKAEWDSWGNSIGQTKNAKGTVIAFDEEIYKSQAADKINLIDLEGVVVEPAASVYTEAEVLAWVARIKAVGPNVPDVTAPEVAAAAAPAAATGILRLFGGT